MHNSPLLMRGDAAHHALMHVDDAADLQIADGDAGAGQLAVRPDHRAGHRHQGPRAGRDRRATRLGPQRHRRWRLANRAGGANVNQLTSSRARGRRIAVGDGMADRCPGARRTGIAVAKRNSSRPLLGRIHTVSATSSDFGGCHDEWACGFEVGAAGVFRSCVYRYGHTEASVKVGVSRRTGWFWWRDARAMKLRKGAGYRRVGQSGDLSRPGGRGHRISFDERVEIMRGCDAGLSFAEIGERIGRDRSVIWREIRRNRLPDGDYHALMAHACATQKARRPKAFKLHDHRLCPAIEDWMDDGWSPKLIAVCWPATIPMTS